MHTCLGFPYSPVFLNHLTALHQRLSSLTNGKAGSFQPRKILGSVWNVFDKGLGMLLGDKAKDSGSVGPSKAVKEVSAPASPVPIEATPSLPAQQQQQPQFAAGNQMPPVGAGGFDINGRPTQPFGVPACPSATAASLQFRTPPRGPVPHGAIPANQHGSYSAMQSVPPQQMLPSTPQQPPVFASQHSMQQQQHQQQQQSYQPQVQAPPSQLQPQHQNQQQQQGWQAPAQPPSQYAPQAPASDPSGVQAIMRTISGEPLQPARQASVPNAMADVSLNDNGPHGGQQQQQHQHQQQQQQPNQQQQQSSNNGLARSASAGDTRAPGDDANKNGEQLPEQVINLHLTRSISLFCFRTRSMQFGCTYIID